MVRNSIERRPLSKYRKCIWCGDPVNKHGSKLFCLDRKCKTAYRAARRLTYKLLSEKDNAEEIANETRRIRKAKKMDKKSFGRELGQVWSTST